MNDNGISGDKGSHVPARREVPHYYGDTSRALFVIGAILIIVAKSTGADIPLSTSASVIAAVLLVIAAGITNPAQGWIHWFNALISIYGTILFGMTAVDRYRTGVNVFDTSFLYVEAITIIALMALYFTTRTIRGFYLRPDLT